MQPARIIIPKMEIDTNRDFGHLAAAASPVQTSMLPPNNNCADDNSADTDRGDVGTTDRGAECGAGRGKRDSTAAESPEPRKKNRMSLSQK